MTDELRELDREWATLAGWKFNEEGFEMWKQPSRGFWQMPARFSSEPAACFGPGGPWEWLVAILPGGACLYDTDYDTDRRGLPRFQCVLDTAKRPHLFIEEDGNSIFEAITRCAIAARQKLEAK